MNEQVGEGSLPRVVVAGAAGGIGKAILTQLQGRAQVIAIVQNAEQRAEVAPLVADGIACDLADRASAAEAIDAVSRLCAQGLDGLVFAAAIQPVGPLELFDRQALERVFAVNVFGTVQTLQGLIPALRRRRGRIVVFSSMAGRVATPMLGAYSGSKFAIEGLADALRRELAPSGITVTLVEPGGVRTPMASAQGALVTRLLDELDHNQEQIYGPMLRGYLTTAESALKHASLPQDVARVVVAALLGGNRPRARYAVGTDAKLVIAMGRWLPTAWLDALLVKLLLGKKS